MNIDKISVGENPPDDVNVIIEVPVGSEPVKYEIDKASGALFVDRIVHTSMRYPANYGFVPHTLSEDGDPVDVLVAARTPLISGCVVRARPVGVLLMTDEGGPDEKILAVPVDKLHPFYLGVTNYDQLPALQIEQITHFFAHYKDLEKDKWVKIEGWKNAEVAQQKIMEAITRAG